MGEPACGEACGGRLAALNDGLRVGGVGGAGFVDDIGWSGDIESDTAVGIDDDEPCLKVLDRLGGGGVGLELMIGGNGKCGVISAKASSEIGEDRPESAIKGLERKCACLRAGGVGGGFFCDGGLALLSVSSISSAFVG